MVSCQTESVSRFADRRVHRIRSPDHLQQIVNASVCMSSPWELRLLIGSQNVAVVYRMASRVGLTKPAMQPVGTVVELPSGIWQSASEKPWTDPHRGLEQWHVPMHVRSSVTFR
jgi:hypothetical protein